MKKRFATALAAATVLALALLPAPGAFAQEGSVPPATEALRPPSLRLGAGVALPVSDDLEFLHGPGPSVAAGLDVPISEALDVTFDAGYTRLRFDREDDLDRLFELALPPQVGNLDVDVSGGASHLISGMAGLKWTFATPGQAAFYLGGGTGLYYLTTGDPEIEARDQDGNVVGESTGDIRSSEEGASFGFLARAGARVPVAAGVDLFVEPRYTLFLEDSHYFSAQAGLAFDGLFEAAGAPARQRGDAGYSVASALRRYEVSAGYRGTFFGDGDETGAAYRAEVARRFLSSRTGLALAGAYRRAVDTDLQTALDWKKRYGAAADLTFFVDALRFETGRVAHRLRIGTGPAVRRQWGEELRSIRSGTPERPLQVERWREEGYRVRRISTNGEYAQYLFTEEFDETQWGAAFKLEYVLEFGRVTAGPSAGYWYYGGGGPAMSYGLQVGVPFGALLR